MILPLLAPTLLVGCTPKDGPAIGDPDLARIDIQISYEPDAAPYTGNAPLGGDTWQLFETNAAALFDGTGVTVSVPTTLAGMQEIPDPGDQDFDVDRLLELDEQFRTVEASDDTRVFHAIWLDGYFADEDGRNEGVIGVSIGDTGVIAMFKPVIEGLGITETVRRFGEQTTFIHEVGHAVGLVDNGVAMQNDHRDEENGAHCDDDSCVMYYSNEGAADLVEFIGQYVVSGDTVIFDDDCLADVRGAF